MQRLGAVARFLLLSLLLVLALGGCLWLVIATRTVFDIGFNLQSAGWLRRGSGADDRQAGRRNGLLQSELACRRGGWSALWSLWLLLRWQWRQLRQRRLQRRRLRQLLRRGLLRREKGRDAFSYSTTVTLTASLGLMLRKQVRRRPLLSTPGSDVSRCG